MATIADLLNHHNSLKSISDTALLDCEILLGHCLGKNRSYLKAFAEAQVASEITSQYTQLVERRAQGEPIAYLIGYRDFWTLQLEVNASTLIPRPETELLVEQSLQCLADLREEPVRVLDLGTGTGAIALALSSECPQWEITGVDIQQQAIDLARQNQQANGLEQNRLQFMQSDWFDKIDDKQFDLIVSNPPYIDKQDPHLQQGDVRFEPHSALVAESRGLAALDHIIVHAKAYLNRSGWLLLEHGYDQGTAVKKLFANSGYKQRATIKDLSGNDRVSLGQWCG